MTSSGLAYSDIYEPDEFGSAGGGGQNNGGRGGGRIWINVTNTFDIDGLVSANGAKGSTVDGYVGGGGSGGSIWIYTDVIKGYGSIESNGGDGSYYYYRNPHSGAVTERGAGGGSGGRIALYFSVSV